MDNEKRLSSFKKPDSLEGILRKLEGLLGHAEEAARKEVDLKSTLPRIYIMGCARSGTTLIYQYLAASQSFIFPTNLISRFYYAPLLGSMIQKALVEYDFRSEIFTGDNAIAFESNLGKTKGPLAPHEFWYYWRKYFPVKEFQKIDDALYSPGMGARFVEGLAALQTARHKPLVLKGMYLNWDIPVLNALDGSAFFLNVYRDPVDNAISLLEARKAYFGNVSEWYSFKPRGYEKILHLSPEHQTLWQVITTNDAIREQCKYLSRGNFLDVNYRDFCNAPKDLLQTLSGKAGFEIDPGASDIPFKHKTSPRRNEIDWDLIQREIQPFLDSQ